MSSFEGMLKSADDVLQGIRDILFEEKESGRLQHIKDIVVGQYSYSADFPQIWVVDEQILNESQAQNIVEDDSVIVQFYTVEADKDPEAAYVMSREDALVLVDVFESNYTRRDPQDDPYFTKVEFLDVSLVDSPNASSIYVSSFCMRMKFYFRRGRFKKELNKKRI